MENKYELFPFDYKYIGDERWWIDTLSDKRETVELPPL